jgi:glycosyltransferase involved in cell wall biosynthesis
MPPEAPTLLTVIPNLAGGGAERVVLILLRELAARWRLVVVLFERRLAYPEELTPEVTCRFLDTGHNVGICGQVRRLARIIREEQPAVVSAVLFHANLLAVAAHRWARSRARLVLSEHSPLTFSLSEVRLPGMKGLAARLLYPLADGIICVSRGVKDDLVQNFGIPRHKIHVILNPCDPDRLVRLAARPLNHPWFSADLPVFVALGRLVPVKNFSLLLRACALARAETPLRLMILGRGPLEQALKQEAKALALEDAVDFQGFRENPFPYLAKARALVISSIQEGFPMALLEAMALKVPVITTRCFGAEEAVVGHGDHGLLVPVDDAPALAAALTLLARDGDLARRLGAAGRDRLEQFRPHRVAARYEEVFLGGGRETPVLRPHVLDPGG